MEQPVDEEGLSDFEEQQLHTASEGSGDDSMEPGLEECEDGEGTDDMMEDDDEDEQQLTPDGDGDMPRSFLAAARRRAR